MSGIQMAMLAIGGVTNTSIVMTTGSTTFTSKGTTYYAGYIGINSSSAGLLTFGSMTNASFKGEEVEGLYWDSPDNYSTNGSIYIEVSGNRANGYVASVSSNGVSLGTAVFNSYSGTSTNTSIFKVGGNGLANPFGTAGNTRIIVIT